jgi:2-polyprenyl-6-methoxyphenol hydroxylase-like FAD-dependent oxidoreductase
MSVDCDVIVVGAGPVGLTTALLLRQFGHNVQVLERHAKRYPQPRAVVIFHQGVRAFGGLSLLDRMFESDAFQDIRGTVDELFTYVDGEGQTLARHPFNGKLSKSGTARSYAMHQPTLEGELEKACQERGVIMHLSVEVKSVVDVGDHVEVGITKVNGVEKNSEPAGILTAWFVVGCDGANSTVRKSANTKFKEFEAASSRWLVVDVIPITPNSSYQWKDGYHSKQYLDPKRPRTSVPSPSTRMRWEFMLMPDESTEMASSDEFIWKILSSFDCGPETAIIERRTVYSIGGG